METDGQPSYLGGNFLGKVDNLGYYVSLTAIPLYFWDEMVEKPVSKMRGVTQAFLLAFNTRNELFQIRACGFLDW